MASEPAAQTTLAIARGGPNTENTIRLDEIRRIVPV